MYAKQIFIRMYPKQFSAQICKWVGPPGARSHKGQQLNHFPNIPLFFSNLYITNLFYQPFDTYSNLQKTENVAFMKYIKRCNKIFLIVNYNLIITFTLAPYLPNPDSRSNLVFWFLLVIWHLWFFPFCIFEGIYVFPHLRNVNCFTQSKIFKPNFTPRKMLNSQ